MSTMYNEPGQGRKQCPGCKGYVGVRTETCPQCKHSFNGKPPKEEEGPKEIKTYKEGGLGKKQCPACELFVGARNFVCACGHVFKKEVPVEPIKVVAKPKVEVAAVVVEKKPDLICEVLAPAGKCPFPLEGTTPEIVQAWRDKVQAVYVAKGQRLAACGLNLFVQHFFRHGTPEYQKVLAAL